MPGLYIEQCTKIAIPHMDEILEGIFVVVAVVFFVVIFSWLTFPMLWAMYR